MAFETIKGDRPENGERGRRGGFDEPEQILCGKCETRSGVATSMAVRAILSPVRQNGHVRGEERLLCLPCLVAGEVTIFQ